MAWEEREVPSRPPADVLFVVRTRAARERHLIPAFPVIRYA